MKTPPYLIKLKTSISFNTYTIFNTLIFIITIKRRKTIFITSSSPQNWPPTIVFQLFFGLRKYNNNPL